MSGERRGWFRIWHAVVLTLVLGGVIGGIMALWPIAKDARTATAIESVATAAGAFVGLLAAAATAVAAIAAMKAARQSEDTARHAMEALGLVMEPTISASPQTALAPQMKWTVSNTSRWPATDIEIEIRPAFGKSQTHRIARLEQNETPGSLATFTIPSLPRPPATEETGWAGSIEWTDEVLARYSDERGLLRWEMFLGMVRTFNSDSPDDAGISTAPGYGRVRRLG